MSKFKEFMLSKLESLHVKLNYGRNYDLNSTSGMVERSKDLIRYEQLKEVVRENPEWNDEEFSKELSLRIRKKTSLN